MAEVYAGFLSHADHELGRLLDYLEETGELDNTIIVLVSDNGASGEGGPERLGQREQVLQRRPRLDRGEPRAARRARQPDDLQPLPDRLGVGVQHAVQAVEALRQLRGRHGRPADRLLAAGHRARPARSAASTTTRSTSSRRCSSASASSCRTSSTATPSTRSRASASPTTFDDADAPTAQGDAVLLDARHAGDLAPGLEGGDRGPGRARSRGATSTSSAGSSSTPTTTRASATTWPTEHPEQAAGADRALVGRGGPLPGAAARVARRARDPRRPSGPQLSRPRTRYVYYPGGAEIPESVAPEHPQPLVHDRGRGRGRDAGGRAACSSRRARASAATRSTSKDGQLQLRLQLDRRARPDDRVRTSRSRPATSSLSASLRARGRRRCPPPGTLTPPHPRRAGRRGHDHDPARQVRAGRRRAGRRRARAPSRSPTTTRASAPWAFVGGADHQRVVIDVSGEPFVDLAQEARAAFARQ